MKYNPVEPLSTAKKIERYYFLDGMRGWASLTVVFWQVFIQSYPINPQLTEFLKYLPPFNGTLAVELFFVISGFSLSIGYFNHHRFKLLARIGTSRYLRLVIPIFFACTLVHFSMVWGIISPFEMRPIPYSDFLRFESTASHLFKFSLFDVFFKFSYDQAYIIPLWTMSIELIGSIMTIAILAVFGRNARAFCVISTTLFLYLIFVKSFYSLFVAGMFISHFFTPRNVISNKRHQAILWVVFFLGCSGPFITNNEALSPFFVLPVIMLFGSAIWITPIRQIFENRTSQFFGSISFSLYLLHGPALWTFSLWLQTLLEPYKFSIGHENFLIGLSTILVSIGAAIIFRPIDIFAIFASRIFGTWIVNSTESRLCFLKDKFGTAPISKMNSEK